MENFEFGLSLFPSDMTAEEFLDTRYLQGKASKYEKLKSKLRSLYGKSRYQTFSRWLLLPSPLMIHPGVIIIMKKRNYKKRLTPMTNH